MREQLNLKEALNSLHPKHSFSIQRKILQAISCYESLVYVVMCTTFKATKHFGIVNIKKVSLFYHLPLSEAPLQLSSVLSSHISVQLSLPRANK